MTYNRPGKTQSSNVLLNFRVTPDESDRIKALAYYLRIPYGQMLRDLAEEKRAALIADGKRPPVRPPQVETDTGPKTPRRKP